MHVNVVKLRMALKVTCKMRLSFFAPLLLLMFTFALAFSFIPHSNAQATQIELYYDDGVAIGAGSIGFYGVCFSLPEGVSSAKLLSIRYAWYSANDNLTMHLTGANFSGELTPPIATTSSVGMGAGWSSLDVSSKNLTVLGDFCVTVSTTGQPRNTLLFSNITTTSDNRSFWGHQLLV